MFTPEYIKSKIQEQYDIIEAANLEITKIRNKCTHSETSVEKVMWRPGAFMNAEVCKACGKIF